MHASRSSVRSVMLASATRLSFMAAAACASALSVEPSSPSLPPCCALPLDTSAALMPMLDRLVSTCGQRTQVMA
jgi:hypothetical protein